MIRCEFHPDRSAIEVSITIDGTAVGMDLCEECRAPLEDLVRRAEELEVARPKPPASPTRAVAKPGGHRSIEAMSGRIRNIPPGVQPRG